MVPDGAGWTRLGAHRATSVETRVEAGGTVLQSALGGVLLVPFVALTMSDAAARFIGAVVLAVVLWVALRAWVSGRRPAARLDLYERGLTVAVGGRLRVVCYDTTSGRQDTVRHVGGHTVHVHTLTDLDGKTLELRGTWRRSWLGVVRHSGFGDADQWAPAIARAVAEAQAPAAAALVSTVRTSRAAAGLTALGLVLVPSTAVAYVVMNVLAGQNFQRLRAQCAISHAGVAWTRSYPVGLPLCAVIFPALAVLAAVGVMVLRRPAASWLAFAVLVPALVLTAGGVFNLEDYVSYAGGEAGTFGSPCGSG
ncbi:hypothetical protein F0L68_38865 [Solihabitans fulvus]|uniref:Uncharacterized protein n=1 Tax=Solihabitans fulvus TaxID=1892852 RepID=A0A5B2WJY8_9PSEU|nr:hypothetical protein [Solihabitans fulvus]KAA2250719.1 hypothetical protein F0L68_38865 [Solihabitans fulvus]